jgi:hypothetical protein
MKSRSYSVLWIFFLSILLGNCSTNKKSQNAMGNDTQAEPKKGFPTAPPVGPPAYGPGMVGVEALVVTKANNGDELLFEIQINKILGSGAASKKPTLGQKIELNYPISEKTQQAVELVNKGAIIRLTLSSTPSITEGTEQWFCEKIHLTN